jgi:hypothetical protein
VIDRNYAYGHCHALSTALAQLAPSGEIFGLFVDGSCIHTAFRVPHTEHHLDAFGIETGPDARDRMATRYVRSGEAHEWRPLTESEVRSMVAGDKARSIRAARSLAVQLLAQAW